ncbi:MAG: hypothetical protein ACJ77B_02520 [Chloroflexota bacterium]
MTPEPPVGMKRTFGLSRRARRRSTVALVAGIGAGAVLFATALIWRNPVGGVAAALLIAGTVARWHVRNKQTLELDDAGVTYEEQGLRIRSLWPNIEHLVRTGPRATDLGLGLRVAGVVNETYSAKTARWRRKPYPYDRTIPLAPFVDTFSGSEVERLIRDHAPAALEGNVGSIDVPHATPTQRRLGLVVVALPSLAAAALLAIHITTRSLSPGTIRPIAFAFVVGLVVIPVLWVGRADTGERFSQNIGRVLVDPRRGESRRRAVTPLAWGYLAMVVVGQLGSFATAPGTASVPGCVPVGLPLGRPAASPAWPSTPHASIDIQLPDPWARVPLEESQFDSWLLASPRADNAAFRAFVSDQIGHGLVTLYERDATPAATFRVYEATCAGIDTADEIRQLITADAKSRGLAEPLLDHVKLGDREVERARYEEATTSAYVRSVVYGWREHDRVFEAVSNVFDGTLDPTAIEGALSR